MGDYQAILERSRRDPGGFWLEAAEAIDWHRPPATALDAGQAPFYRWFPDGELNTSYNALDRHVEAGRGEQAALVYDSPVTGRAVRTPMPSCATRSPGAPVPWPASAWSRATVSSSTCRWCQRR
jgi:hypothetical protein